MNNFLEIVYTKPSIKRKKKKNCLPFCFSRVVYLRKLHLGKSVTCGNQPYLGIFKFKRALAIVIPIYLGKSGIL